MNNYDGARYTYNSMTKQINVLMIWSIVCIYDEDERNALSEMIKNITSDPRTFYKTLFNLTICLIIII